MSLWRAAEFTALAALIKRELGDGPAAFISHPGNLGDALIREGTLSFFADYDICYTEYDARVLSDLHGFSRRKYAEHLALRFATFGTLSKFPLSLAGIAKQHNVAILRGGGAFCEYCDTGMFLATIAARYFDCVIVLPSTYALPLARLPENILFVPRDVYESLSAFPSSSFCHDLAFYLNPLHRIPERRVGLHFRADNESKHSIPIPQGNCDISQTGAECTPADIMFDEIGKSRIIVTDRLHVCIAGALLGRQVIVFEGAYFKTRAIFDSSIRQNYPHVSLVQSWGEAEQLMFDNKRKECLPRRNAMYNKNQQIIVSLIVATLGRKCPLERLLESLCRQTFKAFEVIIIDQNPPGFLSPILERFHDQLSPIHIVSERGLSRARNAGLSIARGDLIAFPDDDCWYEPDTIDRVVDAFSIKQDIGMISGRTLDAQNKESLMRYLNKEVPISKENIFKTVNTNALFVRKDAVKLVHGFDEMLGVGADTPFLSGEESDFVLRALLEGIKGRFDPHLFVHHDQVDNSPPRKQLQRASKYAAGHGAVLRKHFSPSNFAYHILRVFVGTIKQAVLFRGLNARLRLTWMRGVCIGYLTWPRSARELAFRKDRGWE